MPDTAEGMLGQLRADALAPAFAHLDSLGYLADVEVVSLGETGAPTGTFLRHVRLSADGSLQMTGTESGSLTDTSGLDAERLRLRDPLPSVLPDEPPYLDPSTRDRYTFGAWMPGAHSARASADSAATKLSIRTASIAFDAQSGGIAAVSVVRASNSPVYTEHTTVNVRLAQVAGRPIPERIVTDTQITTMLGTPRHLRLTWTVLEVGGQSLTPVASN
jgi:hypothetical protein